MSSPTPGSDPNYPQGGVPEGQQGWGAPQPPQGQQGWGAPQPQGYSPAPSYGAAPAGYGAAAGARPPQVLTAAILGFVVALFALIGALGFFALSSLLGIFVLFGILYLALAAINIWGGVLAMQGKNSTILKVAGLITAGLAALGLILALTQSSFSFWSILLIAAGLGIFFLLTQPVSKQFFAANGGK
jgi:hypothetical protein